MILRGENKVVVNVQNLSKIYKVYHGFGRGWLKSILLPRRHRSNFYTTVEALKEVTFALREGEVLGIIGRNGSGKSTLLKIIAGLSKPTKGEVSVRKKVRALLSLGVNFHPSFSGRENIIFGSMAMGIPRKVTLERMDEIISFTELGSYIEMPVQFYSSGMRSRLAAAVAFQEFPEILIIDEALAAGDGYFVSKCMNRIEEICKSGSTVLFVSHGIALVERLCTRTILLEDGRLIADGAPSRVVNQYRKALADYQEKRLEEITGSIDNQHSPSVPVWFSTPPDNKELTEKATQSHSPKSSLGESSKISLQAGQMMISGLETIEILDIFMTGKDGKRRKAFKHDEQVELHLFIKAKEPIKRARFYLELYSEDFGIKLTEIGSAYQSASKRKFAQFFPANLHGAYELKMVWPRNPLGSGTYYWNVYFAPPATEMQHNTPAEYYVMAYRVCPFRSVSFPGHEWARIRRTIIEPETRFELNKISEKRSASVNSTETK